MRRAIPWPMRPRPMKPTFMTFPLSYSCTLPLLGELPLDPLQLARDVVDDVTGLEVVGQHIPRIRFDLEVRRERRLLVECQRLLEGKSCGAKRTAEIVEEH